MATDSEPGVFLLVNIAAQRARQLMQGAAPLFRTKSRKPAAIALREVENGLLPFYRIEDQPPLADIETEEVAEDEDE
ncbi:MAG: DNA-directed RNA polymerase subunit omega [Vicinamibacteria bacterium]